MDFSLPLSVSLKASKEIARKAKLAALSVELHSCIHNPHKNFFNKNNSQSFQLISLDDESSNSK
jgi:hypothetical protein